MWDWHDQVKDLFRFFVNPNKSKLGTGKRESSLDELEAVSTHTGSDDGGNGGNKRAYTTSQLVGLIAGPLLFVLTLIFFNPADLSSEGVAITAATIWIAIWWMTEAVPIPVTSLLPLVLFPVTEGLEMGETASAYGDENIFLFMGGFMIALTMEKWNLHRRIALTII